MPVRRDDRFRRALTLIPSSKDKAMRRRVLNGPLQSEWRFRKLYKWLGAVRWGRSIGLRPSHPKRGVEVTIEARKEPLTAGLDHRPDGPESYRLTERDATSWRLFGRVVPYVSHDFRARLNALVLTVELLQRYADAGPLSPERARQYAEKMAADLRLLERMVRASLEAVHDDRRTCGPTPSTAPADGSTPRHGPRAAS